MANNDMWPDNLTAEEFQAQVIDLGFANEMTLGFGLKRLHPLSKRINTLLDELPKSDIPEFSNEVLTVPELSDVYVVVSKWESFQSVKAAA